MQALGSAEGMFMCTYESRVVLIAGLVHRRDKLLTSMQSLTADKRLNAATASIPEELQWVMFSEASSHRLAPVRIFVSASSPFAHTGQLDSSAM